MGQGLLASCYHREGDALACEGVPLRRIADALGTPTYVYSAASIRSQYAELAAALAPLGAHLHYSVKANSNLAILSLLRSLGAGVDIVSGGELHRALVAGFDGRQIVFSGVGKTRAELAAAVAARVRSVNVESEGELRLVQAVAAEQGAVVAVALRVNPNVPVDTPHPYTRTGEHGMKFGIPHERIVPAARDARGMPNVQLVGLAAHVGSQITDMVPYETAADVLLALRRAIEAEQLARISVLDLGGGLAVPYDDEERPDLAAYTSALRRVAEEPGVELLVEPGRFLVAESGVLLTRVLYRKRSGGQEIVITDAGMNDLIRPSLYASHHRIEVVERHGGDPIHANVVGPVCESGDFFARNRAMIDAAPGDLLALRTVGAYGYVMASNYNSRPRPAEVLVDGDRFGVVTERESYEDLARRERTTPRWMES